MEMYTTLGISGYTMCWKLYHLNMYGAHVESTQSKNQHWRHDKPRAKCSTLFFAHLGLGPKDCEWRPWPNSLGMHWSLVISLVCVASGNFMVRCLGSSIQSIHLALHGQVSKAQIPSGFVDVTWSESCSPNMPICPVQDALVHLRGYKPLLKPCNEFIATKKTKNGLQPRDQW